MTISFKKIYSAIQKQDASSRTHPVFWIMELRFPYGDGSGFAECLQQGIQILFPGETEYFFLSLKADDQIAEGSVNLPLLEESLGNGQPFEYPFYPGKGDIPHTADAESAQIQRLFPQTALIKVGAAQLVLPEDIGRQCGIGQGFGSNVHKDVPFR